MIFRIYKIIGFVVILFSLSSCQQEKSSVTADPLYFDIVTLIDRQVELLSSINPSLVKAYEVEGKVETRTLGDINWEGELSIFKEADLNSPVLRGKYLKKEEKTDQGKRVSYTPIDILQKGISTFVVEFDESENPTSIQTELISDNIVFSSQRKLSLYFDQLKGTPILKSYSILSKENLIFKKEEANRLNGTITFP